MTTEGGVRVMTTVGRVLDQLEREAGQGPAAPDHYSPCGAGRGATPKLGDVTRIWRSDWPRPPVRPGRDGRKQPHSTSGKVFPRHKDVLPRPHDMI